MLRGHYRCHPQIIQYCNEMVYHNKLIVVPRNDDKQHPLPPMGWVHANFEVKKSSDDSKGSPEEAELIARFICSRWARIHEFYKVKDQKLNRSPRGISGLIAIVTPYKFQADLLRTALIKEVERFRDASPTLCDGLDDDELNRIVIGTVDSLQGAEKPIIIFSGVHGEKARGSPLFSEQPSLLNVAVSRAQDCFVAFVCEKTYGITGIDLDQVNLDELKVDSIRYLGYYLKKYGKRILPRRLVVIESPGRRKR